MTPPLDVYYAPCVALWFLLSSVLLCRHVPDRAWRPGVSPVAPEIASTIIVSFLLIVFTEMLRPLVFLVLGAEVHIEFNRPSYDATQKMRAH